MRIERTKNATRNIIFGTMLKVYQILIPFLMRTAMIYYMGVEYLGLSSLFTSILQVLNLAELGVGSAMVFSMYKPIAENDSTTICALMRLYRTYYRVIGCVIAIVGIIMTPFIPKLIKSDLPAELDVYILYLLNLTATVLSYWLFAYKNCLLQAFQRIDVTSKVLLVTNSLQYFLQILTIVLIGNYYIYSVIALLTQAVTNIVTAAVTNKMYPEYHPNGKLPREAVQNINQRIKDLFTSKLGTVILGSVDTIVISSFLGLTVLAVYQNYYYIMNSVIGIITVIFNSVLAGMGNSFTTETTEKNYDDFEKFTFIICFILCVCSSCFIGLYQPFMEIWVGPNLMLPFSCVILFVIYFYVCELAMVWATVKDATGLWHQDRFRPLIGAMTNLVLNIALVNHIGLYGILLSTIISYVFISMPWLIRNIFSFLFKMELKKYMFKVFRYVAVTLLSCLLSLFVCYYIPYEGLVGLILKGCICVLIPCVLQILIYHKTHEFTQSFLIIRRIFRRG